MEDADSQTINVGPTHSVELSVGTYVSIKKNKQNLSYICSKVHANPAAFRRNNTNQSKEIQNAIRGIVDLIENTPFLESAEITKICVWASNMIICADPAYREDFINSSKNIFQALSAHFVRVSPSQTENSSNNEEYQTLALIYQLLMSTRRPQESIGSKKGGQQENEKQDNNVKSMREKLLNKEFMRKILEINPEELAPSSELVFETQKMLIAFISLFAQKKEKITAFGLIRSAKDKIFELIRNVYISSKQNSRSASDISIHQALACFNAMIEILNCSGKELVKHDLVVILTELLDNNNTTSAQLSVILRILLIITKQNLLSYKPSYLTLCLGKAFKVFERVPSQAAQLITEIVKKDPLALNDITLSTTLGLLRGTYFPSQIPQFTNILSINAKQSSQIQLADFQLPQWGSLYSVAGFSLSSSPANSPLRDMQTTRNSSLQDSQQFTNGNSTQRSLKAGSIF